MISEPGTVAWRDAWGAHAEHSFLLHGEWSGATVLTAMQSVMERAHIRKDASATVHVVSGPGGFSRVRLGGVLANALAWALNWELRERGQRVRMIRPQYERPPNITMPSVQS